MNEEVIQQLKDLYGLNPEIPHRAFQFPRLPPGITHPMFHLHQNFQKEKFLQRTKSLKNLDEYHRQYQQHASGLFTMHTMIIPPGHPLYSEKNSIEFLKAENDKLVKQNIELKKKLEKHSKD